MTNGQFLELRNALDTLRTFFGANAVILNGSTKEIDDKIEECYGDAIPRPKHKTLLCGVEIIGLQSEQPAPAPVAGETAR